DRAVRTRLPARGGRFALLQDASGLGERQFLHGVAAGTGWMARRDRRDRTRGRLPHERGVARAIRIRLVMTTGAGRRLFLVGQRFHSALNADAIDVALSENGAQPRGQAAAPLVVAKERLPLTRGGPDAVQLRVQRIGDLARALRAIERVGSAIQERPVLADESLPRVLVAFGTQPCELEIGGMGAHVQPASSVTTSLSLLPQSFPPRRFGSNRKIRTHLLSDVRDGPTGEPRQLLSLASAPVEKRLTVLGGRAAGLGAGPRMTEHVASLEIRAIARLLEHEIFGKVRVVVTDVQPRQEHARWLAVAAVDPEDAEPAQLVVRQRIGGARVAPLHVPRVLEEHGAAILVLDLPREHRLVEGGELVRLFQ